MDESQTLQVELQSATTPKVGKIMPKFHFNAAEARQMMVDMDLKSTKELLKALLQPASTLARPPISQFHVGAAGVTPAGDVYIGVNVEFPDMPLNNSIHAEQFLIANLKHHKEAELSVVAVNAAPCGHCRQFFSELQCAETLEFLFANDSKWRSYRLHELLPMRFKPQDLLGDDPPPLLLSPQNHPFKFSEDAPASIAQQSSNPLFESAAQVALQEAQESYCPYSNCPAGVAIITKDGKVYGGGYMESCAYNPSMQVLFWHTSPSHSLAYSEHSVRARFARTGSPRMGYYHVLHHLNL